MPDNIHYLGLIAFLWSGARVIVCNRDVRDIAISCWQTGFASISWANDSDHIARRFADYQRLLDHWRATQPLEWLDVFYEDLVHDLEGQTRRLLEFIGLEWDPACLAYHANPRVVRTASLVQVRAPVHTQSIGRWRRLRGLRPRLIPSPRAPWRESERVGLTPAQPAFGLAAEVPGGTGEWVSLGTSAGFSKMMTCCQGRNSIGGA